MKTRTLTRLALMTAAALVLSYLESFIPLPLPGWKIGLANVVTLLLLTADTPLQALAVLVARLLLGTLFSTNPGALLYAAAGGLLAFGVMFALKKCLPGRLSPVGLSIAGAAAHHAGQVGVACLILGSTAPLAFLPFLLGVSLPTGALTGALCIALGRAVKREE